MTPERPNPNVWVRNPDTGTHLLTPSAETELFKYTREGQRLDFHHAFHTGAHKVHALGDVSLGWTIYTRPTALRIYAYEAVYDSDTRILLPHDEYERRHGRRVLANRWVLADGNKHLLYDTELQWEAARQSLSEHYKQRTVCQEGYKLGWSEVYGPVVQYRAVHFTSREDDGGCELLHEGQFFDNIRRWTFQQMAIPSQQQHPESAVPVHSRVREWVRKQGRSSTPGPASKKQIKGGHA